MALIIDGNTSKVVESQASDPTASTNPAGGVGTVILNTTTGKIFTCTDATNNANVWTTVGADANEITKQSSDPTVSNPATPTLGDMILNTSTGKLFVCTTVASGANVWQAGVDGTVEPSYQATGGTITTVGSYKYHTFTSSGTFQVTSLASGSMEYMIVAGGAGGAGGHGGGGGGGGLLENNAFTPSVASYSVSIGAGGAAKTSDGNGSAGTDSTFNSQTASGGGYGGGYGNSGGNGGSGGGSGGATGGISAGAGTSGQGNDGGRGASGANSAGGGGGGKGGIGSVGDNSSPYGIGGNGGAGYDWKSLGTNYAGGGGGGSDSSRAGGTGGGGQGAGSQGNAVVGTANRGHGGGGGGAAGSHPFRSGAAGGSGVVVIRYLA